MATWTVLQYMKMMFDTTASALTIKPITGTPQYGVDATGQDAYATIVTASGAKTHLYVSNAGTHPVILSINGGTTDHLYLQGATSHVFDSIAIIATAVIQAKNGAAGSNYTNLTVTIW